MKLKRLVDMIAGRIHQDARDVQRCDELWGNDHSISRYDASGSLVFPFFPTGKGVFAGFVGWAPCCGAPQIKHGSDFNLISAPQQLQKAATSYLLSYVYLDAPENRKIQY